MELSLDTSLVFIPKTISDFLAQLSTMEDSSQRSSELDAYVKRLEDEMRKIEVFKRELPLCMLLLKDAIERLKEKVMQCKKMEDRPVIEEFIPLKGNLDENGEGVLGKENSDKKNWMSSAQLWSTSLNVFEYSKHDSVSGLRLRNVEDDRSVPENPIEPSDNRAMGRTFVPFKEQYESGFTGTCLKDDRRSHRGGSVSGLAGQLKLQNKPQHQSQQQQPFRKQRRCWSPELHRRFVESLQQLGGTQVATPKQIRELMQVDGLTNDEVKSHLQKYRLHVRKLPTSSAAKGNGIWMPLDHSADHSKANNSQSGSPQGPLLPGEFAKGRSTTGGESENSREAEEDEKSDGQSWKGGLLHNNQGGDV
ncbi:myb family transcription factor EFM isoform X1 [Prunus yedoensis var. nudiflora]|uniref:Myb family transcription factor EFM isoform X1 n=1 Tax=Prunus yedoensis var. nudiflora TaxID=2094558 RepID=A0A314ZFQ7_PRUYE|nr:myb family transcription factor EFM isoform X1 [Prunus yedoensis var. nudiflora]